MIFNGANYALENQQMLTDRGVWRIDSGIDAICRLTAPKNTELFARMGVLSGEECAAQRGEVLRDPEEAEEKMRANA